MALCPGITPNVIQGTGITWTVSPSLPGGINLDSSTGVISGTPTVASSQTTYQVTAANSVGSVSANLQPGKRPSSNGDFISSKFLHSY